MNTIFQDFHRDVWCLFGLPIDNLTMTSAMRLVAERAAEADNAVLATVNVNWVVQSLRDPEFRNAILNSDIVTIDGKPLLWLSTLFGLPTNEVVPGSTLIQALLNKRPVGRPLTIFLFGGKEGVAQRAMERINSLSGGLKAVGSFSPGFGSVEQMSSSEVIAAINKTRPDILLVALGAKKGTQWIEYNRHRLEAGIISHLGATIDFLAGTVRRAPELYRELGVEWAWRILQDPGLFTRYANDGLVLLRFIITRVFWWRQFVSLQKKQREAMDVAILLEERGNKMILTLGRNLQITKDSPVRNIFGRCAGTNKDLILDFRNTRSVDAAFMGLLLLLVKHQVRNGKKLAVVNVNRRLRRLFAFFHIAPVRRRSGHSGAKKNFFLC